MKYVTSWIAGLCLVVFLNAQVCAAEIEWSNVPFQHISENQPIDNLLKDLFISQGLILSISDAVKGNTVSGKFNQPAHKVFEQLTSTFDLIWYFDGHIVYIYRANEVENITIALKHISTMRFKQILNQMMITDERFPLRCYPTEKVVLAFGPKAYIKRIEDTAKMVDTRQNAVEEAKLNAKPPIIRVFRLKHAWAEDKTLHLNDRDVVIKGVATILRDLMNDKSDAAETKTLAPAGFQSPKGNVFKVPQKKHMNALKNVTYIPGAQISQPRDDDTADGIEVPSTGGTIQSASRVNAVIIKDKPLSMPFHEKLIRELDVPLQLVEIQASIIDVDNDALKSLGVDWTYTSRNNDMSLDITSDTTPLDALGNSFLSPQSPHKTPGGLNVATIIGNLADGLLFARLHALENEGKAKIISRPAIITFDNIEAQFTHTNTFYVRVSSTENASLFEVSTGIILKVTPHVIKENSRQKIQLVVNIEDGNIKNQNVDNIPVVENSTINTQAVVDENESLLVGGLIYDTQTQTQKKVPLLGSIPVLGNLFRYKKDTKTKLERMFLISPRIITADSRNQAYDRNSGSHLSSGITIGPYNPDAPSDQPKPSTPGEIQLFTTTF